MRKLLPFLLIVVLAGCGKKEWSKEYMSSKCNTEMKKNSQITGLLTDDKIAKVCDCVGEKMVEKYKSESDANKDKAGVTELSKNCTIEVMMPKGEQ